MNETKMEAGRANDPFVEAIVEAISPRSEGNPGAINAQVVLLMERDDAWSRLEDMDALGLRGPAIWRAFADHCGGDVHQFADRLRLRDAALAAPEDAPQEPEEEG